jgi:hypothetical protein
MDHPSPTNRVPPNRRLPHQMSGAQLLTQPSTPQNVNSKPSTADPKKHQKAGSGTTVEAGVGMDGFIEGCVSRPLSALFLTSVSACLSLHFSLSLSLSLSQSSDWMLQRLQKEQIDSTVNVHMTQMSTPLPSRSDAVIWKQIPELNVPSSPSLTSSLV